MIWKSFCISSNRFVSVSTIILISILYLASGCSPVRHMKEDQALVRGVKVKGGNAKGLDELRNYIRQKPNRKFLFVFDLYLGFYYWGEKVKNPRFKDKLQNNLGEEPVIYDSTLTSVSEKQIQSFAQSKGYFNAEISSSVKIRKKKAYITYTLDAKKPYSIRSIDFEIPDTSLSIIYFDNADKIEIKSNARYDAEALKDEQQRIFDVMKNNGYYKFRRQYVSFNIDSALNNHQVDIILKISNPDSTNNHQIYTIDYVTIDIDGSDDPMETTDTSMSVTSKDGFNIIDHKLKYNPKILRNMSFLKRGDIYRQKNVELSYSRYGDLGVFKFININFKEVPDSTINLLKTYINLSSSDKLSIRPEIEGTFNSGNLGANGNLIFTNKNLFTGAELFELKLRGSFETQRSISGNENVPFFYRRESNATVNIYFPKLLSPFRFSSSNRLGNPRTIISTSYTYEKRVQYYRSNINASFGYEWKETTLKSHFLRIADINVVSSGLSPETEAQLRAIGNRSFLESFTPYFSLGTQYRYIYNGQNINQRRNFIYFKGMLDVAGNTLNLASNLFGGVADSNGSYKVFGLIYYQYIRPETEIRYYKIFDRKNTVVFRANAGVGIAYGNSKALPFEKLFFIGGSNSIRAWQARRLGPGIHSFSDSISENTLGLDRFGDIKLEGNIEYRFDIVQKLFGAAVRAATFLDFGNIWSYRTDPALPGSQFDAKTFYKQLALGTGFGLRFDYTFFIFRFDVGLKLRDPQFTDDRKWVINYFGSPALKQQYNYQWLNYNFGIGYPF